MPSKREICRTLFGTLFRISAFTFGGGFVIIPLIRKQFVERLRWLKEEEMLDIIAIAQTSPGAMAVNVATQLGSRFAGWQGAVCAALGALLPPILWLVVISFFYDAMRTSPVVSAFLHSMQPAVAAVILCASVSMAAKLKHKERLRTWVILLGALAGVFLGLSAIWILLVCGLLSAIWTWMEGKRHAG